MRPELFSSHTVAQLLQHKTVATLDELSAELAPCSERTLHRKLKNLDYLSSYSHRGKYYTLLESTDFNSHGLWEYKGIQFSQYGTLYNTIKKLVEASPCGYRSSELDAMVKVRTTNALGKLVDEGKLSCISLERSRIYCSANLTERKRQIAARRLHQADMAIPVSTEMDDSILHALARFFSLLNEKHRRRFAGLLSLFFGHGGDKRVAELLGMNQKTIRKGRRELNSDEVDSNRIRKSGGGRPSIEKKTLRSLNGSLKR